MTTKEDGTGLGLAICARLVKEMKGKIRVFSKPGEGACFVVSLPVAEEEERCP
jgi:two-component system sensor histidine kinase FlrB